VTFSMLSIISSIEKNRPKYISCRARFPIRLEVDSSPSTKDPFK